MYDRAKTVQRLKSLLARPIVLYVAFALILVGIADRKKYQLRVLNSARNAARYINRHAMGLEPFDEAVFLESIDYLKTMPKRFPEFGVSYGVLGYVYYHLGEIEKALAAYEKASRLLDDHFGFHYNRGLLCFKLGRFAEAEEALSKALETDPKISLEHHAKVGVSMIEDKDALKIWLVQSVQRVERTRGHAQKLLRISRHLLAADGEADQEKLDSLDVNLYYYIPLYETGIIPLSSINAENVDSFK